MSSLVHAKISAKIVELNPPRLFFNDQCGFCWYWYELQGNLIRFITWTIESGEVFFFDDFWKLDTHYNLGKCLGSSLGNSFDDFYQAAIASENELAVRSLEFWRSNSYNP